MRRRRLLLFALVLLGGLVLLARALPDWLAGQLARTLSAAFHRPVVLGEVRFHAYPLSVELKDLRVGGEGPGSAPFLEVPRVLVTPSIAPLRFGRLVLSRVRLEEPRHLRPQLPPGRRQHPEDGDGRRRRDRGQRRPHHHPEGRARPRARAGPDGPGPARLQGPPRGPPPPRPGGRPLLRPGHPPLRHGSGPAGERRREPRDRRARGHRGVRPPACARHRPRLARPDPVRRAAPSASSPSTDRWTSTCSSST